MVDRAGNCFVQLGQHSVARIQGRAHDSQKSGDRALRAPSYRVLFALLADSNLLNASVRDLARQSGGVSPQTADDLRKRMMERGILVRSRFDGWVWGGGAACHQLTEYCRGDDLVMYLTAPPPELPKRLALVRDASGPIALANAPGPLALTGPTLHTAHLCWLPASSAR